MAIAEGSSIYFAYKKEAVANTEESGAGGTVLRRASGTLNLTKQEVVSAEKRTDFQEVNVNHGTRQVDWGINGEGFAGDYKEFQAAVLRRDWTSVSQITGDFSISLGTLTRAAGDFISDGLRIGHIVRLGVMGTSANLNRNLRVVAITTTTVDLVAVDGGAAVADDAGPNASATMDIVGQVTFIPESGHTSDTFTIERHDSKTDTSDIGKGCKVGQFDISVQPDQPITMSFSGLGIDRRSVDGASAPSLTSPTAAGAGPSFAAAIGFARSVSEDGATSTVLAVITGFDISINTGVQNRAVAFANVSPDVFYGRVAEVTGTINALREGNVLSDYFDNEEEISLEFFVEAPGTAPRSFFSIYLPRVKLNSADQDDPDGPVVQTFAFRALKETNGTSGHEQTTILIQDSDIT